MVKDLRLHVIGLIAAVATGCLVVVSDVLHPLDLAAHDRLVALNRQMGSQVYAGPDVVIVGFDETFLSRMPEPFALVHTHLSRALLAISEGQPKVVAIDLNLPSKPFGFLGYRDKPEINFDTELARGLGTLSRKVPVVLAVAWNAGKGAHDEVLPGFVAAANWMREPLAGTSQGRDPRASVTVCPDSDGTVRAFPGRRCQALEKMPSFATRIMEAMGRRAPDEGLVNFSIGEAHRYVPVSALLEAYDARDIARIGQLVDGKVVIVAAILNYADRLPLPAKVSAWEPGATFLPGALFHAQAVRTLAAGAMVTAWGKGALCGVAVLMSLLWFCPGLGTKAAIALVVVPVVSFAGFLLLRQGQLAPVATLSLLAFVPLSCRLGWDIRTVSRERAFLDTVFRGSVSPNVLDGILAGRLDPKRRGARVRVHVMFADIRGFTHLSERTEPERVIRILNAYLGEATQAVHGANGTIDKFLGDGVLAVFGAPESLADPWNAALSAARDLVARIARLNAEHADYVITPIELGIGIHAGDAIVGFVGSSERREFTAIGDTVNVASRIQGLTAELGFPILASVDALPDGGRLPRGDGTPLGPQKIKGHTDIDIVGFKA